MASALLNAQTIRTQVCAQCYGPLVEQFLDGAFIVVCPKHCQPGGFVSAEFALKRKSESIGELYEFQRLYPQFRKAPKSGSADNALLFGE